MVLIESPEKDGVPPTTYFAYGSNLWLQQMANRCPTSTYLGVARLNHYRWIINDRGYANIVSSPAAAIADGNDAMMDVVYGLVYSLLKDDEARLDANEGVPDAYTKEYLPVEFWPLVQKTVDIQVKAQPAEMLVYIDRKRITESTPKKEYVYRMNKGIADALKMGIPRKYVDTYIRKFIPEVEDSGVEDLARRQALEFHAER